MSRYRIVHEQYFDGRAQVYMAHWCPQRLVTVLGFAFWLRYSECGGGGGSTVSFQTEEEARAFLERIVAGVPQGGKWAITTIKEFEP